MTGENAAKKTGKFEFTPDPETSPSSTNSEGEGHLKGAQPKKKNLFILPKNLPPTEQLERELNESMNVDIDRTRVNPGSSQGGNMSVFSSIISTSQGLGHVAGAGNTSKKKKRKNELYVVNQNIRLGGGGKQASAHKWFIDYSHEGHDCLRFILLKQLLKVIVRIKLFSLFPPPFFLLFFAAASTKRHCFPRFWWESCETTLFWMAFSCPRSVNCF